MHKNFFRDGENALSYLALWIVFFLYVLLAGMTIQLVILPHVFPKWNGVAGLLMGTDSVGFHLQAVDLATNIEKFGLSAWALDPSGSGNAPVGIAALFYAYAVKAPWVLLPLNAAIYATSALLLFWLVKQIVHDWRWAALSALPLLLFPSAAMVYSQIHKDVFSMLGMYLLTISWTILHTTEFMQTRTETFRFAIILCTALVGSFMLWLVRPYLLQIAVLSGILLTCIFSGRAIKEFLARKLSFSVAVLRPIVMASCIIAINVIFAAYADGRSGLDAPATPISATPIPARAASGSATPIPARAASGWIDKKVWQLDNARRGFNSTEGASRVDREVQFGSLTDVVFYSPRALQLALFSPLPSMWFSSGSTDVSKLQRAISSVETMVSDLILGCLLLLGIFRIRKAAFWVPIVFSSVPLLILGLVVSNMGTLYRMRFGFLMVLLALGIASIAHYLAQRGEAHKIVKASSHG